MKKEDFDLLTESLEQAVAYRNGDQTAARSVEMSWFTTDLGDVYEFYDSLSEYDRRKYVIRFIEEYFGIKLKHYQKVMLMTPWKRRKDAR